MNQNNREAEYLKNNEKYKLLLENYSLPENYIIIRFKIKNLLLSKIDINPEAVSIYPYKKPKVKVTKRSYANKYYIYDLFNYDLSPFETNYGKGFKEN